MIDKRLITPEIAALVQGLLHLDPSTTGTVDRDREEKITRLVLMYDEMRTVELERLRAQAKLHEQRFEPPKFMAATTH